MAKSKRKPGSAHALSRRRRPPMPNAYQRIAERIVDLANRSFPSTGEIATILSDERESTSPPHRTRQVQE